MATETSQNVSPAPTPDTPAVHDRRVPPRGVLPRHIQTWLMVGLAFVMVTIILLTGRTSSPTRTGATARSAEPALAPADRIRGYEQQLAAEEARQRAVAARGAIAPPAATSPKTPVAPTEPAGPAPTRDDRSLFADNVALSRRSRDQQPVSTPSAASLVRQAVAGEDATAAMDRVLARLEAMRPARPEPMSPPSAAAAPTIAAAPTSGAPASTGHESDESPAPAPRLRIVEGTTIETALLNRLDGTFAGPVVCLVTTPVYTGDRQSVLIPAGARVLGAAAPVQSWGDSRLAVSFHRLVMPDGHTYSLDGFKGLNAIGESGLRDRVNRHYAQVFGASLAIGALSGLAQFGTRTSVNALDFGTEYRQAAGSSLASSAGRVLDRYLNVLPTVTIREGYRLLVYLTNDLALPVYATGGAQ